MQTATRHLPESQRRGTSWTGDEMNLGCFWRQEISQWICFTAVSNSISCQGPSASNNFQKITSSCRCQEKNTIIFFSSTPSKSSQFKRKLAQFKQAFGKNILMMQVRTKAMKLSVTWRFPKSAAKKSCKQLAMIPLWPLIGKSDLDYYCFDSKNCSADKNLPDAHVFASDLTKNSLRFFHSPQIHQVHFCKFFVWQLCKFAAS